MFCGMSNVNEYDPEWLGFVIQWSSAFYSRMARGTEREGQALINALHDVRPDLGREMTASPSDPFYNDNRIVTFGYAVHRAWLAAQGSMQ